MARTFAYLFGAGGLLLLLTLLLGHAYDQSLVGLIAVALAAELVAAGFLVGFDRIPARVFRLAPGLGSVLIGFVLYWGGGAGSSAYAMYFFWVVLSTALFFELRWLIANLTFAAAIYAAVLALWPETPLPILHWVMASGALSVAGVVIVMLRNQAERAERRKAAGERRTRRILDTAHDAYVAIDDHGLITDWNPQAENIFGWSREEVLGRELAETIIPESHRDAHRRGLERFRETGKGNVFDRRLEMSAMQRDGREFPVELTITALESGGDYSFHAFLRDVTERRAADNRLRESEERNRLLVNSVADYAIFMLDSKGRVSSWNPAAERIKGYTAEEILGHSISIFYPVDDVRAGKPADLLAAAIREGSVEDEGWRVRKDGTHFWAETTITALRTENGGLRGFSKITRDLTERWRTERYRQALHAATRVLAESGTVEEAFPSLLRAIGESMDWQVGGFWMPGGDGPRLKLACVAFWHGLRAAPVEFEAATKELQLAPGEGLPGRVWASSEPAWIEDVARADNFPRGPAATKDGLHAGIAVPILSEGNVLGVIEFASEEIRRPDPGLLAMLDTLSHQIGQFLRRKRAETEGDRVKTEFLAVVSHELRTPLTSIIGYLELLLEDREEKMALERRREFLGVIDRNSNRLLRLVGDLLFVAQVEGGNVELDRTDFDLAELAGESVEAGRVRAEQEGLELRAELADVGLCFGDRCRIAQAIDNLISNSIKFTPPGGSITVRLSAGEAGSAVIEIADTGMGVPEAEQERLFERFYRANAARTQSIEGTGLGLAIVEAIVEGHGGEVTFESTEGRGTTFRISLPLAPRTTPDGVPAAVASTTGAALSRSTASRAADDS